ncbi:MAG: 4Fe-4S binding protein, partial [Syntrophomonadaceae bacterium]|nr:4Fe-4S binding protein [Syntrophomonadaceae bacterium]
MTANPKSMSYDVLKQLFLDSRADDVGFVELERPALAPQRDTIEALFPAARTLAAFVLRLNRDNLLAPTRILASYETNRVMVELSQVQANVFKALRSSGIRSMLLPAAYPMEMNPPKGKRMDISHKEVALQAGMGIMGNSRLLLHPRWGSTIILGTMLLDCSIEHYDQPLEEEVCIHCNLCIAACPVGAIGKERKFNFQSCLIHNYR